MTVSSVGGLSAQYLALEQEALGAYRNGDASFSFPPGQANGSADSSISSGDKFSGSFQSGMLYEVGTMEGGQLEMFTPKQIQAEESAASAVQQSAYDDTLQNFLTLSQAAGSTGLIGGTSLTEQGMFVGAGGDFSVGYDASYSLEPVGVSVEA